MTLFRACLLLPVVVLLGGCNFVVLDPSGDIALQQRDLIVIATVLMLLVILPVMVLTVYFAWRYRHSNKAADYDPEWDHSMQLELVIWAAPLLIIICLGAVTWMGTHLLDPYRPLDRISAEAQPTEVQQPLEVEVVALDWKWLFIYPQYDIATVNELAAPVDRPIRFKITSSSVMNSFFVPALAGQIYAMPGMETKLNAVINEQGTYEGFSANYSGAGFSQMRFAFHGFDDADFDQWVEKVKASDGTLQADSYLELERPSESVPVTYYGSVDPALYNAILNLCVDPGKMCMGEMMSIDDSGGLGLAGIHNVRPLEYDKSTRRGAVFGPEPAYVASICTIDNPLDSKPGDEPAWAPRDLTPLQGSGLARPSLRGAGLRPPGERAPTSTSADLASPSNS
ncbi:ubiquinol oxidase subunit II [Amorphus sp. 3PC139-8]|uniref:ubiquinol oxidase subunit II n=1 Tax=Amorphus sp. 3PC139-8 TaxID=2735676 RepID=UPI00345DB1D0